jgi:DNA mismatch repair protein MutL
MKNIINILPENVANQIAAGEVVQRPASVLKELLENSIDAGSSKIHVEIKNAGKTSILVSDDGIGMTKADAGICFNRHATSKIFSAIDLFNIRSKGFRGEALASIAAIAHIQLISKQKNDQLGTQIEINGSQLVSNKSIVAENGTKILVKNLFFNIPARRKFLKSNNVENKHIMNEFFRISLSHPEVNFIFFNDGNEIYNLKSSTFKRRIIELFGNKTNEKLVPINEETEILRLNGFIFKPEYSKKTRGEQYFFINNRFIKSPYLNHAVKVAFEGLIDTNYNPSYFLNLHVDPKTIDINIHPTKTEIKFEDEHSIFAILRSSIKHSLGQYNISPVLDFERDKNLDIPYDFDKNSRDGSMGIEINSNYNPFKNNKTISLGNANNNFKKDEYTLQFSSDSKDFNQLDFKDLNSSVNTNQIIQFNKKYIINKTKSSLVVINQLAR